MKPNSILHSWLVAVCFLLIANFSVFAQGTAFTYQGLLSDNGSPANGNYDLRFSLRDAIAAGNAVGTTNTVAPAIVSNGLFTVTLDFGADVFTGPARWLEIGVRTNGSVGAYLTLGPRQLITPTPYAIRAANFSGPVSASQLPPNIARLDANQTFSGAVALTNAANILAGDGSRLTGISSLDSAGGGPVDVLSVDGAGRVAIGTNTSGGALQVAGGTNLFSGANLKLLNVITNNSTVVGVSNLLSPVNVFISGTRAYVTSYTPGSLEIFDISNPLLPHLLGEVVDDSIRPGSPFTHLSGADGVFVTNNIAYVTSESENTLNIINVADPQNPVKLAEVTDGVGGFNGLQLPTDVIVSGTNCFVLGFLDSALTILDVSNPSNPKLIKEIFDDSTVPGSPFTKLMYPYQMTLVGTRLYIAARGDSAVTILNVANPASPQLLGEIVDRTVNPLSPFTKLTNVNGIEIVGNVAYVVSGAFRSDLGSLTLIDISNPASPIKLAELSDDVVEPGSPFTKLAGAWAVKVAGDTAFITSYGDNALTAIDVSDPRNPRLLKELVDGVGGFNHLAFTEGLAISGNTLFVAGDLDSALNLIDLRAQLGLVVDQFVGIGTSTPRSALDVAGVIMARGLNVDGAMMATGNGEFANLASHGSILVDGSNSNSGTLLPGLAFGLGSAEGIASKRTAGAGQFGLDFYTGFQRRMQIANNGNVSVGPNAPNHRLSISGGPAWTANGWVGAMDFENASAIGWKGNAGGQHFGIGQSTGGLYFLRTTSDPGTTATGANYDLEITDSGNVLVAGGAERAGVKLQVNGGAAFGPMGSGGEVQFGSPSGETGLTIIGSARADIRFDGSTLKLLAGPAGGPPSAANGVAISTAGNVGIGTAAPGTKLHVIGNIFATGTITPNSDRNAKTNFAPVDAATILDKVAALPISSWRFKTEAEAVKHIGPMAQDFRAAFGLGEIPTAIATVDADGVALAAIQGLNQKLEEQRAENTELKARLDRLEKLIERTALQKH